MICTPSLLRILLFCIAFCPTISLFSVGSIPGVRSWYVATDGSDLNGNGTSSNPYQTIGKAVTMANSGDTVQLAAGDYSSTTNNHIIVLKNITIKGPEIISGSKATIIEDRATPIYRIFYIGNASVTIENINFAGMKNGGVEISGNSPTVATITGCTFSKNSATSGGGMIVHALSTTSITATISGCTFSENPGTTGGGMLLQADDDSTLTATITGCTFSNNSATAGGGLAVKTSGSGLPAKATTTISGCTFVNNTATQGGGLSQSISFATQTTTITGCTFSNNSATSGGGIFSDATQSTVTTTISQCRFYQNEAMSALNNIHASDDGQGVYTYTHNWWGSNGGPDGTVIGGSSLQPWLIISPTVTANPQTISGSGGSVVTAFLNWRTSDGSPLPSPFVLPPVPIQFLPSFGTMNPPSVLGTTTGTSTFYPGITLRTSDVHKASQVATIGIQIDAYQLPSGTQITVNPSGVPPQPPKKVCGTIKRYPHSYKKKAVLCMNWKKGQQTNVDHYDIFAAGKLIGSIPVTHATKFCKRLHSPYLCHKKLPKKYLSYLNKKYRIRAVAPTGEVSTFTKLKVVKQSKIDKGLQE